MIRLYFTDFFQVSVAALNEYGAFNISLINDIPLFVDPFLLFTSKDERYRALHDEIIDYVRFLRDTSLSGPVSAGLLDSLFTFHEVKQNWLGFSVVGNRGTGLGPKFARALNFNLKSVFRSFGDSNAPNHIEKLCLLEDGVGKDNISDFTTCLIKRFLLEYTEEFARRHIAPALLKPRTVSRVSFDYETETWRPGRFLLPNYQNDFVILTPQNILTRDSLWINQDEMLMQFENLADAVPNEQLRSQLDSYLRKKLREISHDAEKEPPKEEVKKAKLDTLRQFPFLMDQYTSQKENTGHRAALVSIRKVHESGSFYVDQLRKLADVLDVAGFYKESPETYEGALRRLKILKTAIETEGHAGLLYFNRFPIRRQEDLQRAIRILWCAAPGAVTIKNTKKHFKISPKLASNPNLSGAFEKLSSREIIAVFCFSETEVTLTNGRVASLHDKKKRDSIVLIDATRGENAETSNSKSGSQAGGTQRTQLFVSYSHKDKKWLKELQITLKPSIRSDNYELWDDTRIKPGDDWREEIRAALKRTRVAVLLVSRYFFDSDFIAENELPDLLDAAKDEGVVILWVAVSDSPYKKSRLAKYQAVNDPGKPLDGMTKAKVNQAFVAIAEEIDSAFGR